MADTDIVLGVELESDKATKEINKLREQFAKVKEEIQKSKNKLSELTAELDKQSKKKKELIAQEQTLLGELQKQKQAMQEYNAMPAEKQLASSYHLPDAKSQMAQTKSEIEAIRNKITDIENAETKINNRIAETNTKLQNSESKLGNIKKNYSDVVKKAKEHNNEIKKTTKSTSGLDKSFGNFYKRVAGLAKRVLIFSVITKALRALRNAIGDIITQDAALNKQVQQIKANFAVIGMTLFQSLRPVIEWVFKVLTVITSAIANLIAMVTGKNLSEMQQKAEAQAKAQEQAEKSSAKQAKNEKKITKEKEKQLASWDTLQKFDEELKEDTSADTPTTDASASGASLDFGGISQMTADELAKIGALTGLALVGLGLLLCFFGHLPLGLGMVAVGAVLIWKSLTMKNVDPGLKDKIAKWVVLSGMILIALGLILILVGNLPIGIGALVAGLTLMIGAAAIGQETMSKDTKEMLEAITILAGSALLAIGIMLLPVNLPLGLACIIAGIGSLVTAVALNWDTLKEPISKFFDWVGNAFWETLDAIKENFLTWWEGLKAVLVGVWNFIIFPFKTFYNIVKAVILTVVDLFRTGGKNIGKIWQGVWDGIKAGFKFMINGLIGFLNMLISGLNIVLLPLRGVILGVSKIFGSSWTLSDVKIPKIPYLASGAVIPGGAPFAAVLGDQPKGQTNIETPEALLRQIIREESANNNFELTVKATQSWEQFLRFMVFELHRAEKQVVI